ncbi:hypothetical protein HWI79_49 [Cryptosporidium felis]|nr:hypothetical protein HWI79_49 [Cryptosporidium felis]
MYVGVQKKNAVSELELVGDIPKTDRLDTDIVSPASYDDIFELLPYSRTSKKGDELSVEMPEELKGHMAELLRFCGIDEFDEENAQLEKVDNCTSPSKGTKVKSSIRSYCLGPPFLLRLTRYNFLEKRIPNFFDFGSNLTLPASFQISEYRVTHSLHPRDNPWYKGCKKLILLGIPSFLRLQDLKGIILSYVGKPACGFKIRSVGSSQEGSKLSSLPSETGFSISELGIRSFTYMFTTESRDNFLNNLYQPVGALVKDHVNMAALEFLDEEGALDFWASLSTGSLQFYGTVLTAIPDPSGNRIFAEGMLSVFSPGNLPLLESIESSEKGILQKDYTDSSETRLSLVFPLVCSPSSLEALKNAIDGILKERVDPNSYVFEEANGCLLVHSRNFKAMELLNNRLFQHCTFKVPSESVTYESSMGGNYQLVSTAMIHLGDRLCEPVVVQGDFVIHPIKHRLIDQLVIEKKREKNSKITFSPAIQSEQDPEPVGFLFKKFEELREALQHDLAPNSTNADDNHPGSTQTAPKSIRNPPRTPMGMDAIEDSNTPKSASNPLSVVNNKLPSAHLEGPENPIEEPPDSPPRRSNKKRALYNLFQEDKVEPKAREYTSSSSGTGKAKQTSKSDRNKADRYASRRRASTEPPKKNQRYRRN